MYKRIVSIGAHSLDAELLGGAIMCKYVKQGAKGTLIHVTQGRLEDPKATQEEKDAYLLKMKTQNANAAQALGCDMISMGYVSSNMPSEEEFINYLVEYFKKENVDLVISHWMGTLHARHYWTHKTVTEAVRRARRQGLHVDLIYGETNEDLVAWIPQRYIELNKEEEEQWFKALQCYSVFNGEVNDNPYLAYYQTSGKVRQMEIGAKNFARAYMYASLLDVE